jgi:sortase A
VRDTARRSRLIAIGSALMIALGAAGLTAGLWIPAKALAAQYLLRLAWQRSYQNTEPVRAWPWADTWPVAELHFPTLGLSQVVLAGSTGESLAFGPGHTLGSAPPGRSGTSIISGHRDTHFSRLDELRPGDEVRIDRRDGVTIDYRITSRRVVNAPTSRILDAEDDRLVLVTCWPLDAVVPGGPLRLVLSASRVHTTR